MSENNLRLLLKIHDSAVFEEVLGGQVLIRWTSGADIDADGANGQNGGPFAYRMDDKGLDTLSDAGYPHGAWQDVLEADPQYLSLPRQDSDGNIYSLTTYQPPVDAYSVPYVVVNPLVRKRATGVVIGCRAAVQYLGKTIDAVVADVGPEWKIGEISVAAARELGIPDSPRTGGVASHVIYTLYPGVSAVVNGVTYSLQPM